MPSSAFPAKDDDICPRCFGLIRRGDPVRFKGLRRPECAGECVGTDSLYEATKT